MPRNRSRLYRRFDRARPSPLRHRDPPDAAELKRPEKTPDLLLLDVEAAWLNETVDTLRDHVSVL